MFVIVWSLLVIFCVFGTLIVIVRIAEWLSIALERRRGRGFRSPSGW